MATMFRNVVIFGDSLSDIGLMAKTGMGKFAKAIGQMTVNPTGRYSDCRNWTDHMYEAATGDTLVSGGVRTTMNASTVHQSFRPPCRCDVPGDKWFRYANYAMGGACGGIPHAKSKRIALATMKSEVEAFAKDLPTAQVAKGERFLFVVWFGANDLYTAEAPANLMGDVAQKIAVKRRNEIATLVEPKNAKFIFVNLGLPLAAARYQEVYDRHEQKAQQAINKLMTSQRSKKDVKRLDKWEKTRRTINNFESGAMLFNNSLRNITGRSGDIYVDMSPVISRESVSGLLEQLHLVDGVQTEGTSDTFISANDYDSQQHKTLISTSDKAHPTDRVYRLMWEKIRETLWEHRYTFGRLPE